MKINYFPSLSTSGWIDDSNITAGYLFSQFLESDYSQTQLYLTHVASFAKIMQEHQLDPEKIASKTERVLRDYYNRYYNNVTVQTEAIPDPTQPDPNKYVVNLYISYDDKNGIQQTLAKTFDVVESKVQNVTNISNYGTVTGVN